MTSEASENTSFFRFYFTQCYLIETVQFDLGRMFSRHLEAEENWGEEINCHQMGGSDEVEGEGQASFRFFSSYSLLTSIQHVGSIPCGSFRGLPILCVSRKEIVADLRQASVRYFTFGTGSY